VSRVNGDVRGNSPTTHVDLLDQILSERLISPVATVRADPMTLTLHVLAVFVGDLLSWTHGDDQRSYWERTQIGFTVSIEKRNSSRHVSFLSVLGVFSVLGSGRSVCSLVGGDGVLTQLASLGDGHTVLQSPGTNLGVLLTLGASSFAGAARLALVGRSTASTTSMLNVRRECCIEYSRVGLRKIDLEKREAPESIASPEPLSLFLCHSY